MSLKLSAANDVKVYNIGASRSLPEWLDMKKKKSLRYDRGIDFISFLPSSSSFFWLISLFVCTRGRDFYFRKNTKTNKNNNQNNKQQTANKKKIKINRVQRKN